MRAFNVLLSVLVVLVMFVLAFEGGLRLLGKGPGKRINQPDEKIGWVKRPDFEVRRRSGEFDALLSTNSLGLREDEMSSPAAADGVFRILCLGDSFTLGYTVDRRDLFVDQLERWWAAEGRPVELVNAGTEGYSTDQEVAWFLEHGAAFEPDLVLLLPYENDIYWNGQLEYLGTPKPRFTPAGELETGHIRHSASWRTDTAIGRVLTGTPQPPRFDAGGARGLLADFLPLLVDPPAALGDAPARTRGALLALRDACAELGTPLVVAPIPSHSAVDPEYRQTFQKWMGLREGAWSPDRPVDFFLSTCADLGIPTLDARPALRAASKGAAPLYYQRDFHLTAAGNATFARFLKPALEKLPGIELPRGEREVAELPAVERAPRPAPFWPKLYGILLLLAGSGYAWTYRSQENPLLGFLKVGVLLAVIFTIAIGGSRLVALLPPSAGQVVLLAFVLVVVGFIVYKLGRRTGTILELFGAFVGRGHWYLMPLVVVLLTIGSLLVVAASSPLVAPFIYTLF